MNETFFDLYAVPRMTETRLKRLLERFRTGEAVFGAGEKELLEVERVDAELATAVRSYRRTPGLGDSIRHARDLGVRTVGYLDAEYPAALRDVPHMPPVLFIRGEVRTEDRVAVAVVGTRTPTHYGRQVAEGLSRELARSGVTVVSGLARGVDTCAHRGAMAGEGRTIAVTGCGIDVCYPPENRALCEEVVTHGAVITEFTLGVEPLAMNFPKRNRIVSALSRAVVAVEAREKSGVLNTVAWAVEQGRDVYAVPGRVGDPQSEGTNRLLHEGARPVTSAADLLKDLGVSRREEIRQAVEVEGEERQVYEFLTNDPVHIDEICEGLGLPMAGLLSTLLQLELKGLVRQLPGKYFARA
jgi:DNA processing protein